MLSLSLSINLLRPALRSYACSFRRVHSGSAGSAGSEGGSSGIAKEGSSTGLGSGGTAAFTDSAAFNVRGLSAGAPGSGGTGGAQGDMSGGGPGIMSGSGTGGMSGATGGAGSVGGAGSGGGAVMSGGAGSGVSGAAGGMGPAAGSVGGTSGPAGGTSSTAGGTGITSPARTGDSGTSGFNPDAYADENGLREFLRNTIPHPPDVVMDNFELLRVNFRPRSTAPPNPPAMRSGFTAVTGESRIAGRVMEDELDTASSGSKPVHKNGGNGTNGNGGGAGCNGGGDANSALKAALDSFGEMTGYM